ncbi:MAG TPA: DNA repair protein RadC [Polyangia bacterium]|nr:DNA repair protein RadC [Polyangia bacterium]
MNDRELTTPSEPPMTPNPPAADAEPADRASAELLSGVLDVKVSTAHRLISRLGGLRALCAAQESELVAAGIHAAKARRLRTSIALARAAIGGRPVLGQRLAGAAEVSAHMRARLADRPVEEFWAIAVDVRHRVLLDQLLARGSLSGVEIHPRDVFRPLIRAAAAAVIFVHNHPSGDPSPSRADIELTERLRQVGELCGIPVLDHVVVAAGGYVSLAERGWR